MRVHWLNEWCRGFVDLSLIRLDVFIGRHSRREIAFVLFGFGVQVEWDA